VKPTLAVLGSLAIVVVLVLNVGSFRQRRSTSQLVETLLAMPPMDVPDRVDFARLDALPVPVARYLRHVLRDGQRPIRAARFIQVGQLRTDVNRTVGRNLRLARLSRRRCTDSCGTRGLPSCHYFMSVCATRMLPGEEPVE